MLSHSKEAALFLCGWFGESKRELEDLRGRESSGPSSGMPKRPGALL